MIIIYNLPVYISTISFVTIPKIVQEPLSHSVWHYTDEMFAFEENHKWNLVPPQYENIQLAADEFLLLKCTLKESGLMEIPFCGKRIN